MSPFQTILPPSCIPLLVSVASPDHTDGDKGPQYLFSTRKSFIKNFVEQIESIQRTEMEKKRIYRKRLREVERWRSKTRQREEHHSNSPS